MGVGSNEWKKVMKMGLLLFGSGFNSSKCKTMAKMIVARIKLLRNKRDVVIKQMRRDIALLLDSRQDATARIRVEHVIREQNILAANELIELFCDLVVARIAIISKQRECPADLKEGISSLIFAAPRCSEIPELMSITNIFRKKYGKDFVSAATDLRPNAGVNRLLIEKLSVNTPPGEIKLKILKEIAKEYHVQWDTTESEEELLKPPEKRIEGPVSFGSASNFPLKPAASEYHNPNHSTESEKSNIKSVQELASAAGVAAEKAVAAAEAAMELANRDSHMSQSQKSRNNSNVSRNSTVKFTHSNSTSSLASENQSERMKKSNSSESGHNAQEDEQSRKVYRRQSYNCQRSTNIKFEESESDADEEIEMEPKPADVDMRKMNRRHNAQQDEQSRKVYRRQSDNCQRSTNIKFEESESEADEEIEMEPKPADLDTRKINRRHSYNCPPAPAVQEFKFDESDEEEVDDHWPSNVTDQPPVRQAPGIPTRRVHPKLPDYDAIAARFEALKHHKPKTRD